LWVPSLGMHEACPYRNPVFQRLPFQVLHGDEGLAFMLADFVDGADVGMIERRGGPRFTLKPFEGLTVRGNALGQELEGDEAAKFGVLGLIDHTHPAATQLLHDPVM